MLESSPTVVAGQGLVACPVSPLHLSPPIAPHSVSAGQARSRISTIRYPLCRRRCPIRARTCIVDKREAMQDMMRRLIVNAGYTVLRIDKGWTVGGLLPRHRKNR